MIQVFLTELNKYKLTVHEVQTQSDVQLVNTKTYTLEKKNEN